MILKSFIHAIELINTWLIGVWPVGGSQVIRVQQLHGYSPVAVQLMTELDKETSVAPFS